MKTHAISFLGRRAALAVVTLTLTVGANPSFALTKTAPKNDVVKTAPARPQAAPAPVAKAPAHTPAVSVPAAGAVTEDIRDIRGPRHIPSPWLWAWWVAGALAGLALGFGAWRWWHRRALLHAKLPFEVALDRLEEARVFLRPETAREFSIAVSEIVRNYIEIRFRVNAARRTTEEFLYDLMEPSDALLADHRDLLGDFLRHCDLAKFARWILSTEEMEAMHRSARTFVLETGRPEAPAIQAVPDVATPPAAVPNLPAAHLNS
jgi:hypothetical protein